MWILDRIEGDRAVIETDQGGLELRILLMCQCFRLVFHAVLLDFGHSWMYDPV